MKYANKIHFFLYSACRTWRFCGYIQKTPKRYYVLAIVRKKKSANVFSVQTHLTYMYRPSQFQVCRILSFCGRTQNNCTRVLLFLRICANYIIRNFCGRTQKNSAWPLSFCASTHKSVFFGISADVRRKTAPDYYHFSAPTQVTIVWSFCGRTQKNSSCLLQFCATTHNSVFWSFCGYTQILMLLKYDSRPNNTHDVLINQNRSFCGRTQILQIWMKN